MLLVCILLSTSFIPAVSASNSDGIISNVIVDKSTVNAGDSVTVTFSVLLSQAHLHSLAIALMYMERLMDQVGQLGSLKDQQNLLVFKQLINWGY